MINLPLMIASNLLRMRKNWSSVYRRLKRCWMKKPKKLKS